MIERQEIYCHDCGNYVRFDLDTSLNGNHVLNCPECGHEHCRVVKDGRITGERWDSRNGRTILIYGATTAATSAWITTGTSTTSTARYFLMQSWLNTTSNS